MTQQTALITGTSSGIGRATALHFQKAGWQVAATMRSPEKETELTSLDNVFVTALDVTKPDTIRTAVQEIINRFGTIDVLVNNAGFSTFGPMEAATDDQVQHQFDVNVVGIIRVTAVVLPHMRSQRQGIIVNISSMGGRVSFPFASLYHSTKFAVEGLTESLVYELAPLGVRVKLIEPGGVNTPFIFQNQVFLDSSALTDYQSTLEAMQAVLSGGDFTTSLSPAELIAQRVYEAATDNTEQLRYPVGADAEQMIGVREQHGYEAFKEMVRQNFLGMNA